MTLTRASNTLFMDLDWTPAMNIQAKDHIYRIGQKSSSVLIKRMSSTHPLDMHMQELIEFKIELAYQVLEARILYKPLKNRHLTQDIGFKEESDEELIARISAADAEANRQIALGKLSAIAGREAAKVNDTPEPELTLQRKDMLRQILSYMVKRCDGAEERDDVGFNNPMLELDTGLMRLVYMMKMICHYGFLNESLCGIVVNLVDTSMKSGNLH